MKLTMTTGKWILKTPFVLAVILFGMLFDGILRMVVTLASQYYRLVQLPESVFGILGSIMAMAGLFIPRLANRIAETRSPSFCLWSTAATALVGLFGMTFFQPIHRGGAGPDRFFRNVHGWILRELFCQPASLLIPACNGSQFQRAGVQPFLRFDRAGLCRPFGNRKRGMDAAPSGPRRWRIWFLKDFFLFPLSLGIGYLLSCH
jgi:hypothetical protein